MWGEVTPAERLRSVTRRNVDDEQLAAAAADALAGFASEPASLVVACRRVLAHHRAHGALWWVCSRILAAPDPAAAARTAVRELEADRTGDRLGATLPLLDEGEVVAIIGYTTTIESDVAGSLASQSLTTELTSPPTYWTGLRTSGSRGSS